MLRTRVIFLIGAAMCCGSVQPVAAEGPTVPIDYLRDIRPILSDACYACHGPDETSREADLRLDQLQAVIADTSATQAVIVAGDPQQSELVRRITSDDPDEVMPPAASGKALTSEQVTLLCRWIEQGATWKEHWSFVKPRRNELPHVREPAWPRNAIDRFVQARFEHRGWQPSPAADKETLIRRATFDLIGLPPTLDEVDAFLADDSPEAYERVVDRLLQSPHYGEHMARFWLDAARYGDTHGLHLDNYREMWPYRDWVVAAFNENLPYDQFTIEQLAGDLLPDATLDQRVATGFCRAHVTTNEGGSIEEEVYTRNVVDRVSTMGTVFLGLTLGCAACHDHKFDPVTQREFYQLFAFFNSLDGPALDGNVKDPAPVVSVPSPAQAELLEALQKQVSELRAQRDGRQATDDPGYSQWLRTRSQRAYRGEFDPELHLANGLVVHCDFDQQTGQSVVNHANADASGRFVGAVERIDGRAGRGLKFADWGRVDLGNVASFNDTDAFSFGAWVKTSNGRNSIVLAKTDASDLHRGYELSLLDGHVTTQISRRQPGYVIKVTTKEDVIPNDQWHHVFVTYDGSHRASGVVIYVDGLPQPTDIWSDALQFKRGIRNTLPLLIGARDQDRSFEGGSVDDVRVYDRRLTDAELRAVFLETQFDFLKSTPSESWTTAEHEALQHFYLLRQDEAFQQDTEQLEALVNQLRSEKLAVPISLVFRERKKPRDAFVLQRGQYDQPGAPVVRATPTSLPPMSDDLPRNRLGLAQWLVAEENPLVSRVAVNRFWQQFFGRGLVETSEDFGSQGAVPSHPELLDWLAVEFRESGWDVKALVRMIAMSATYQQSSYTTPTLVREDPDNRELARGPRFRLDAEMLRDQALSTSGLLVRRLGGPSVKPVQPTGLWKAVGFSSSNTVEFVPDTDPEKIYRRTVYTFYKRTSPPPQMTTFDAPSRESTCVRRERTNTPLQALLLLNDPQYVEAARALAARVMRADLVSLYDRASYMYRLCTARRASKATVNELVQLFRKQLAVYQQDQEAVEKLLAGQFKQASADDASRLAAWTIVANMVLNLDEVITKN